MTNRFAVLGFAVGPIGAAALSFISLPIMTWIFPQQMIGMLSMLQVAIGLSTVLYCAGMDQAYVREYHEVTDRPALLLHAMLPGLLIMLVSLMAMLLLAPRLLSHLLFGESAMNASLLAVACLVMAYVTRFLSLILRMQNRGLAYSMSQVLGKLLLLIIVLCYTLFLPRRDFTELLLAQTAALAITLVVFAWNTHADWISVFGVRLDKSLLASLFSFGWPLVFGSVASWGLAAMDRMFLRSMSTYGELAVYSVAASIAAGVTLVAGIFNTIWAPMVYKWVADEKENLDQLGSIANSISVLVLLIVCATGACSWLLRYFLPPAYAQVPNIVVGCMIAPLFYTLSEVTGVGLAITRRTIFSMLASFGAMLINMFLCMVLVKRMGAAGAMLATATSFWIYFVLRTEFSAHAWKAMPRAKQHFYATAVLLLATTFAFVSGRELAVAPLVWSLLLVIILWVERKALINLFHLATSRKTPVQPLKAEI